MFKTITGGIGLISDLVKLIKKKKGNQKKVNVLDYKHFTKKARSANFDFNKDGVEDIQDLIYLIDQLTREQIKKVLMIASGLTAIVVILKVTGVF